MNVLRPNVSHTNNFYEIGKFKLIWKLSLVTSVIFGILSILFLWMDILVSGLYFTLFSVSVFSLFFLKKYKKIKPIFWLYTIVASIILISSLQSLHYILHYEDLLWMICIIGFAFIGLEYKYALIVALLHAGSFIFFLITSLNKNIETIEIVSNYNLLVMCIESALAFLIMILLLQQYLKYEAYAHTQLKKTKTKYQDIIETMNEALIQDDSNGKIIFWNSKFLEMFGFTKTDMKEMHILDLIDQDFHDAIKNRHFKRIMGEKIEEELVYLGKRKNGTSIWMELNVTPVYENKKIIGTQSLIRDISVRKEQEMQLKRINQELIKIEEAERERIAYELHDGLNQLLIAARIHTDLSSGKDKILEILDAAIAESKSISQNLVPKDINEFGLITAFKILFKKIEQSDKLKIIFNYDDEFDYSNLREHKQFNIYRIVQECLNNTLKHSNADEVIFSITPKDRMLTISFKNNGNKIAADKINSQNFLVAIRRRLSILNGKESIINNVDGNVSFEFNIPLINQSKSIKKAV